MLELGFRIRHLSNEKKFIKEPAQPDDKVIIVSDYNNATVYKSDLEAGDAIERLGLKFNTWAVFRIVEDDPSW